MIWFAAMSVPLLGLAAGEPDGAAVVRAEGFRGIWFTLGQLEGPYGDKYSGGLGTYTADHVPIAIHVPWVGKTFFVFGGTPGPAERHLLAMISYYDHVRWVVARPVVVHDKGGVNDPHDNPSLAIDGRGHLWVFVSGRAEKRPGFIYRSLSPYSIDGFERVAEFQFAYPQPWWMGDSGFLFCLTRYTQGRELYWQTSPDGRTWAPQQKLAGFGGHYQVTATRGTQLVTAFNWHPGGDVDRRTNLYFLQTDDGGQSWRTVTGDPVATPLADVANPALVRDYAAEGRLVYINDVNLDAEGRPVVSYITSGSFRPGPEGEPREWTIAHWTGGEWSYSMVCTTDHNYDMGSLRIEPDAWRIIGPTDPGPQPWCTGGEMVLWESRDQGATWRRACQVTHDSPRNHSYARCPVNAHPEFWALWADGDGLRFSESHLYFTNQAGDRVWRLPYTMAEDFAEPERVR
ncbi:MAG TPA: BNR-4 repeat-containing protein [Armatimonadota bacterium]|nr:BNR-4 repeat-containing protein [Armatimonadota bacterium]